MIFVLILGVLCIVVAIMLCHEKRLEKIIPQQEKFGFTLFTPEATWFPKYRDRVIITDAKGDNAQTGVYLRTVLDTLLFRMDDESMIGIPIPRSSHQLVADGIHEDLAKEFASWQKKIYVERR